MGKYKRAWRKLKSRLEADLQVLPSRQAFLAKEGDYLEAIRAEQAMSTVAGILDEMDQLDGE